MKPDEQGRSGVGCITSQVFHTSKRLVRRNKGCRLHNLCSSFPLGDSVETGTLNGRTVGCNANQQAHPSSHAKCFVLLFKPWPLVLALMVLDLDLGWSEEVIEGAHGDEMVSPTLLCSCTCLSAVQAWYFSQQKGCARFTHQQAKFGQSRYRMSRGATVNAFELGR